jgi:hypothetical protein
MQEIPMTTPQDALLGPDDAYVLDHAAWTSLTGPHARFAKVKGQAARYPADVSPFVTVAPDADEEVFGDLLALVGPGGLVPLAGLAASLPPLAVDPITSSGKGAKSRLPYCTEVPGATGITR